MASERKANAIYGAVHHEMMGLRVMFAGMQRHGEPMPSYEELDRILSGAQHRAAKRATDAYRKPLREAPNA
jgi:hypothetical protein